MSNVCTYLDITLIRCDFSYEFTRVVSSKSFSDIKNYRVWASTVTISVHLWGYRRPFSSDINSFSLPTGNMGIPCWDLEWEIPALLLQFLYTSIKHSKKTCNSNFSFYLLLFLYPRQSISFFKKIISNMRGSRLI